MQGEILSIVYDGDPVAHERPRLAKNGGTYTPSKTATYKQALAWKIRELLGPQAPTTENCGVRASFYRSNRHRIDLDNLLKTVLDACTQAGVWVDDSQVHEINARIEKAQQTARVEFTVYRLEVLPPSNVHAGYQFPTTCEQCGGPLPPTKSHPSSWRRFCSRACYSQSRMVEMACRQCGETFTIRKSMAELGTKGTTNYNRAFCSRECSILFHQAGVRPTAKQGWKCESCGGPVSRKEYRLCWGCSMKTRSDPTSNYWQMRFEVGLAKVHPERAAE